MTASVFHTAELKHFWRQKQQKNGPSVFANPNPIANRVPALLGSTVSKVWENSTHNNTPKKTILNSDKIAVGWNGVSTVAGQDFKRKTAGFPFTMLACYLAC